MQALSEPTGRNPLPPNVRLWVFPRWRVEVDGRSVNLTPSQGILVGLLAAPPGRRWTASDLADALYAGRADGGPDHWRYGVWLTGRRLSARLGRAGIVLEMGRAGHHRWLERIYAPTPLAPGPAPPRRARPCAEVPDVPWTAPERVERAGRTVGPSPERG